MIDSSIIQQGIRYLVLALLVLVIGYCSIQKYDSLVQSRSEAQMLSKGIQESQERLQQNLKADASLAESRAVQRDSVRSAVQAARLETQESKNAKEDWFARPDPDWVRVFNTAVRSVGQ